MSSERLINRDNVKEINMLVAFDICPGKAVNRINMVRGTEVNFNQSAFKHGRRTFLDSAMGELVCSGQLWARAALKQLPSDKVGQREHFPATVL